LITTLVDRTTDIFDKNFLELNIDESNLEALKNDAFKNALFYESLKRETVDNYCYLYLLITSNFFSKYNFISYENPKSLEKLIDYYFDFRFKNNHQNISRLDKLILQLSTENFNSSLEIDHIFPTNRLKISKKLDKFLNLNHIGNLCYISKRNNRKKSNKLPSEYFQDLMKKREFELLKEAEKQTFANRLLFNFYHDEIKNIEDFNNFLRYRSLIIRKLVIENLEVI
jgi:hypothetical protein